MPAFFSVDIERGPVSEQSIQGDTPVDTFDVGATGHQRDLSPGKPQSIGASAGPYSSNASEKTRDLYPTQPGEQQIDAISEGWNGGVDCILLFSGLLSMTVSLLIIESYEMSPDAADPAIALFDQVSHLVGIPVGTSPESSSSSPPLGLVPASFEPSSSVGRAATPWLLSLSLNIICVLLMLWQRWWQRSIDPSTQSDEPHAHGQVRVGPPAMGHVVEVIWVLLRVSTLLFLVGLGNFILLIRTPVPRVLLVYPSFFALVYVARKLLRHHFPNPDYLTLPPNSA